MEIGVYRGGTASRLIQEALRYCPSVEYWGFDLFAEGADRHYLDQTANRMIQPLSVAVIAEILANYRAKINLIPGDTGETLASTSPGPVDLLYIDGGHTYDIVKSDWTLCQKFLYDGSVVFFDDYSNPLAEKHEGYGVKRLVDEIDRNVWKVDILDRVDRYVREWGVLESRLARVEMR
jgi:hypothetical protein